MKVQKNYGDLTIYVKNGTTKHIYPLKRGQTNIGGNVDSDIRLKDAKEVICTIDVNEDGIAIISNNSDGIQINGSIVRNKKILKNDDEIEIMGKKVVYHNSGLTDENISLSKKFRRQTEILTRKPRATPKSKKTPLSPRNQRAQTERKVFFSTATHNKIISKRRLSLRTPEIKAVKSGYSKPLPSPLNKSTPKRNRNRSNSTPTTDNNDDSCIYISSDSFQTQSIEDLTTPLSAKQKSFRSTFHTVRSSSTVSTPISEPFKTPLNTPSLFENIRKSAMKSRSRHYKSSSSIMEHIGSSFEADATSTLVVTRSLSTIHQKSLLKDFESESPITNSSRRQSKSDLLVVAETNQNLTNLNVSTIPSDTELNNAMGRTSKIDMKRLIHFSSTPKHSLPDKMSLKNRRSFSIKRLNVNRSSISNLRKSLPTRKSILKEKAVLIKQESDKSAGRQLSNSRFNKKDHSFSSSNEGTYDSDKVTEQSHDLSLRRSSVKNTKSFNAHNDEDKDPIPEKKVRISRSMIVNQSEDFHNSDEEADHYHTKSVNDTSDVKMLINKSEDTNKNFTDESFQSDEDSDTSYVKKFITVRATNLKAIKKSSNTKITNSTRKSLSSKRSTASLNTDINEKSMSDDGDLRQIKNKRSMKRSQYEDFYYSDEEANQLSNSVRKSDVQCNQTNFDKSGTTPKRQSISSMDKSLLSKRSTAKINRSIAENSVLSPNKNLSISKTTASNQEQYEDSYHSNEENIQSYAKQNSASIRKSNLNKSNNSTRRQSKTDMEKSRSTLNINQCDIHQVLDSSPDKKLSVSRSQSESLDVPSDEEVNQQSSNSIRRSNLIASTRKNLGKTVTNRRQSRLDMDESRRSTKINKSIVDNSERLSPGKNVSLSRSMELKQNFNQLKDRENSYDSDEEANESAETDMKNRSLPPRRSTAKINRSIAKNSVILNEDLTQSPNRSMLEENQFDHSYAKGSVSVRRSNLKSSQNSPVRSRQSILNKPLSPRRSIRMINLSIENSGPVNSSNAKLSISRHTENNDDDNHSTNDEETGQFYNLSGRSNITASKETARTDLNKSNTTLKRQSRADMDKSAAKIDKKSLPYEDLPISPKKYVNKSLLPRKSFEIMNKSVEKNQDLIQSDNDIQYEEDSYYSDEETDQYKFVSVRRSNVEISNESAVTKLNKSNPTNKRHSLTGTSKNVSTNSIQTDEEIDQNSNKYDDGQVQTEQESVSVRRSNVKSPASLNKSATRNTRQSVADINKSLSTQRSTTKEKSLIDEEKLRQSPNKKLSRRKSIGMMNKSVERNQDLIHSDHYEDSYYSDENTDQYESVSVRRSNIEITNKSTVTKLNKSNTTNKRQSLASTSKYVSRNSIQTDEEIDQNTNKCDDDQVQTEQESVSVGRSNVKSPASNLNKSATRNTRQSVENMNKSVSTRRSTINEKSLIDEEELRQSPNTKLSPRKSVRMMNKSVESNQDLINSDNDIPYEDNSYYSDEETDQYESVSVSRKSNTTTKRQSLAGTGNNVSRNSIQTDEETNPSPSKYDDDQVQTEQKSVSVRRSNVKSPVRSLNNSSTRSTRQSVENMNKSVSTRRSTINEKSLIDEEELRQSPNKKLSPRKSIRMMNKSVESNQDLINSDNDIQYEDDSYYSDEETDQYEFVSVSRKSNTTTKRQSLAGTSNNVSRNSIQTDEETNPSPNKYDNDQVYTEQESVSVRRSNVKSPVRNLNHSSTRSTRQSVENMNKSLSRRRSTIKKKSLIDEEELRQSPNKKLSISSSTNKIQNFDQPVTEDQCSDVSDEEVNQSYTKQETTALRRSNIKSPFKKSDDANVTNPSQSMAHINKTLSSRRSTAKLNRSDVANSILAEEVLGQKLSNSRSNKVDPDFDQFYNEDPHDVESDEEVNQSYKNTSRRRSNVKSPVSNLNKSFTTRRSATNTNTSINESPNKSISRSSKKNTDFQQCDNDDQYGDDTYQEKANQSNTKQGSLSLRRSTMMSPVRKLNKSNVTTSPHSMNKSRKNTARMYKSDIENSLLAVEDSVQNPIKNLSVSLVKNAEDLYQSIDGNELEENQNLVSIRRSIIKQLSFQKRNTPKRQSNIKKTPVKEENIVYTSARKSSVKKSVGDNSVFMDKNLSTSRSVRQSGDSVFTSEDDEDEINESYSPRKLVTTNSTLNENNQDNDYTSEDEVNETDSEIDLNQPKTISMDQDYEQSNDDKEYYEEQSSYEDDTEDTTNNQSSNNQNLSIEPTRVTDYRGVREMLQSPPNKGRQSDYRGVREMLQSPPNKGRKSDYRGVREMLQSPKNKGRRSDYRGVRELMASPKANDCSYYLEDVSLFNTENSEDVFDKIFDKKPLKTYKGKSMSPQKIIDLSDVPRKSNGDVPVVSPRVNEWVEEHMKVQKNMESTSKWGRKKAVPLQCSSITSSKGDIESRKGRQRKTNKEVSDRIEEDITKDLPKSVRRRNISIKETKSKEQEDVVKEPRKRKNRGSDDKTQQEIKVAKQTKKSRTEIVDSFSEVKENIESLDKDTNDPPKRVTRKKRDNVKQNKAIEEDTELEDPPKLKKQEQNETAVVSNNPPIRITRKRGNAMQKSTKVETTQTPVQNSESLSLEEIITIEETPKPRRGRKNVALDQKTNTDTTESKIEQNEFEEVIIDPPKRTRQKKIDAKHESPTVKENTQTPNQSSENTSKIKTVDKIMSVEDTTKPRKRCKQATPKQKTETTGSKKEKNKGEEVTNDPPKRTMRKRGDATQDSTKVKETSQNLNQSSENASEIKPVDKIITAEDIPKPRRERNQATSKPKIDTETTESKQDHNEIIDTKTIEERITVEDTPKPRRGRKQATSKQKTDTETTESKQEQNEIKENKTVEDTPRHNRRKQATSKQQTDAETTESIQEQNKMEEVTNNPPKRTMRMRGGAKQDSTEIKETTQNLNQSSENESEIKTVDKIITAEDTPKPRRGRKKATSKPKIDTETTESKQDQNEIKRIKTIEETITVEDTPKLRTGRKHATTSKQKIDTETTGSKEEQKEIKDVPKRTYRKRVNAKVIETLKTPNQISERLSEIKTTEEIITVENISKPRRGRKNALSKQKTDTDTTESKQEQTEIQQLSNIPPKRTTRNRGNAKQDSIKVTETGTDQEVETEESAKPQRGRKRKGDDHNTDTPKQQKTTLRTRREKRKVDI